MSNIVRNLASSRAGEIGGSTAAGRPRDDGASNVAFANLVNSAITETGPADAATGDGKSSPSPKHGQRSAGEVAPDDSAAAGDTGPAPPGSSSRQAGVPAAADNPGPTAVATAAPPRSPVTDGADTGITVLTGVASNPLAGKHHAAHHSADRAASAGSSPARISLAPGAAISPPTPIDSRTGHHAAKDPAGPGPAAMVADKIAADARHLGTPSDDVLAAGQTHQSHASPRSTHATPTIETASAQDQQRPDSMTEPALLPSAKQIDPEQISGKHAVPASDPGIWPATGSDPHISTPDDTTPSASRTILMPHQPGSSSAAPTDVHKFPYAQQTTASGTNSSPGQTAPPDRPAPGSTMTVAPGPPTAASPLLHGSPGPANGKLPGADTTNGGTAVALGANQAGPDNTSTATAATTSSPAASNIHAAIAPPTPANPAMLQPAMASAHAVGDQLNPAPSRTTPPTPRIDQAPIGGVATTAAGPATGSAASTVTNGAGNVNGAMQQTAMGNDVATHVLGMIAAGHHEATFQLQPQQLGALTVRIVVQGRNVSAWFGAAQPQVQQAVTQAMDQLQAGLANAGFNLAGAWVGADASGARRPAVYRDTAVRRPSFATAAIAPSSGTEVDTGRLSPGVNIYV
ncbi:MAG: flagellar hook-length control protein FliK [Stellaceae bacterium]